MPPERIVIDLDNAERTTDTVDVELDGETGSRRIDVEVAEEFGGSRQAFPPGGVEAAESAEDGVEMEAGSQARTFGLEYIKDLESRLMRLEGRGLGGPHHPLREEDYGPMPHIQTYASPYAPPPNPYISVPPTRRSRRSRGGRLPQNDIPPSPPQFTPYRGYNSPESSYSGVSRESSTDRGARRPYIDEISYKIDYLTVDAPHGMENVFRTVDGQEPAPRGLNGLDPHDQVTLPAIEVRRKIKVSHPRQFTGMGKLPTALIIHSHYLINALETIFHDCDPQTRTAIQSHRLEIQEPYEVVVAHLDSLKKYKSDYQDQVDIDITVAHIDLLLEFISKAIGVELDAEARFNSEEVPLVTWDWLWTIFKYGETMYSTVGSVTRAYVLYSIKGGPLPLPKGTDGQRDMTHARYYDTDRYTVSCWSLKFDGLHFTRKYKEFRIPRFSGTKEMTSLPVYPSSLLKEDTLCQSLVERGRKVYDVHTESPSHREYNGWTLDRQAREIQSRVVIDHECWDQEKAAMPVQNPPAYGYYGGYDSDCSEDSLDGFDHKPRPMYPRPPYAPGTRPNQQDSRDDKFISYDMIPKSSELTEHQLCLLPNRLHGWILKDRKWAVLDIELVTKIETNKDIFDNLILPEDRTEIIKALVQSHKRRGQAITGLNNELSADRPYSADVVKGKGQGLLILLHGPPGVGKTSTAECVAEYTERPLFPITCGDLGTRPKALEEHLQHAFRLAQRWGAVLLLDEADVFLERRELNDINRNSLVSVFLRILEYYSGILFLTTNRVGSFDEAFTSRLHVSIHYPSLKEAERSKIWNHHVKKLERDREDIHVRENVREYLEDNEELKKIPFNGRQIRNIFQTAVSLALYEAKTDKSLKGRPTLRSEHLRKVVTLSCEFQDYLRNTRDSDSHKAKDAELRDDEYKRNSKQKKKKSKDYDDE